MGQVKAKSSPAANEIIIYLAKLVSRAAGVRQILGVLGESYSPKVC